MLPGVPLASIALLLAGTFHFRGRPTDRLDARRDQVRLRLVNDRVDVLDPKTSERIWLPATALVVSPLIDGNFWESDFWMGG